MNITLDVRRNVFCTTRFTLDEWNLTSDDWIITICERNLISYELILIVCVLNTIVCVLILIIYVLNLVFINLMDVIRSVHDKFTNPFFNLSINGIIGNKANLITFLQETK